MFRLRRRSLCSLFDHTKHIQFSADVKCHWFSLHLSFSHFLRLMISVVSSLDTLNENYAAQIPEKPTT